MQTMTLREAARRCARSITTLRRYIRAGRLVAEKRRGRFGPEYVVSEPALEAAGLHPTSRVSRADLVARRPAVPAAAEATVPVSLFQELQMKHEQLLVQYGMVRAGGMRVLELRAELEAKQRELEASERRIAELRRTFQRETSRLKQLLRRVELEQEGRGLEVAALREKVRGLEMLTHRGAPERTFEKQCSEVMQQIRRVDRLSGRARSRSASAPPAAWNPARGDDADP
jgi:hypothetical protein